MTAKEACMTAKEYLEQYQQALAKISATNVQIEELETILTSTSIRTDGVKVQTSVTNSREELLADLVDMQIELNHMARDAFLLAQEVLMTITKTEDPAMIRLLIYRYVDGMKWKDISERMHFERSWTFRIHAKALEKVEKILFEQRSD